MPSPDVILDMPDDEFMNLGSDAFKSDNKPNVETPDDRPTESDNENTTEQNIDEDGDDTEEDDDNDTLASAEAAESVIKENAGASIDKPIEAATDANIEPDYASIGKLLMSEFKANGSTLKMKSPEDAITLMQMGANYHKKMAGLKPSLKTLKLLENNGLLDPEKLNYLIDLSQKKPEAITQLLRDSKIDPMTIDMDTKETYTPSQRTVNDTDILLDEVLDSISSSPTYSKTLTVLGEEWDSTSRAAIAKNPEVIRAINTHMETGIYDQVAETIAYERSLGKLVGLSDYDAYQRVGAYMHENNMFVTSANVNQSQVAQNQTKPTPQAKQESDAQIQERLNRKQAASPSRQQKTPVKDTTTYNPLDMSDEDFIKLHKLRI